MNDEKTYHEALVNTDVSVTFTATEARRLADFFARMQSGAPTPEDRNAFVVNMKLRFQRASDRANAKARKAMNR